MVLYMLTLSSEHDSFKVDKHAWLRKNILLLNQLHRHPFIGIGMSMIGEANNIT